MKSLIFLILTIFPSYLFCQDYITFPEPIKAIAKTKIEQDFNAGDTVDIISLAAISTAYTNLISFGYIDHEGFQHTFEYKFYKQLEFLPPKSISQKWQMQLLKYGVYENLVKNGMQYDIRNELNEDAIEYVNTLTNEKRLFNDKYFEDYLYTLCNKLHPGVLKDGRPGNVSIIIINDTKPEAFALPNGTITLSTGLLSVIQSEDELIGILAHEIAHFVLDHHVINYNKIIERKKKAEFWAGFASVLSVGADIYLSSKYDNYIPGLLSTSTVLLSTAISQEVVERLGAKYNREQEFEADKVAAEIIDHIQGNRIGLSAALTRLRNFSITSGKYAPLYDTKTHPNTESRIIAIGKVDNISRYVQADYFKKSSYINSFNAWIELWTNANHLNAVELADRNIKNNVATESDYIVKAVAFRRLYNTTETNLEVLELLSIAKNLNVTPNKVIPREEALTYLRLNKRNEAQQALQSYLSILIDEYKNSSGAYAQDLALEIEWTKTMIYKINNL